MRGHKAWRSSLCAPGWHLKMLFFGLWQTDNESIQKCPSRYFSGGLDDRIAFASDDPPLKNGWNFKVVKVPGYLQRLVSLLKFSRHTSLRAIGSTCEDVAAKVSAVAQLPAAVPVPHTEPRRAKAKQAKSGWNLMTAASLEFIDAAALGMEVGTAAQEALRWICL